MIFRILFLIVCLSGFAYAAACPVGAITFNTTLPEDLTSLGTCIIFGANNITLDCAGHSLTHQGVETAAHYGVVITKYNGTRVVNCRILNYTGIYVNTAQNVTIFNTTVSSLKLVGIVAAYAKNLTINSTNVSSYSGTAISFSTFTTNSTIYNVNATSNTSYAILFTIKSENNTLTNVSAYSQRSYAFYPQYSNNIMVINSTFVSDYSTALYLAYTNFTTIKDSSAVVNSNGASKYAMYLLAADNTTIRNSTAYSNSSYAIAIDRSNYTTIANSTAVSNVSYGIYITRAKYNTIANSTAYSNASYAIYIVAADNNSIVNTSASSRAAYAFYLASSNGTSILFSSFYSNSSAAIYNSLSNYTLIANSTFVSNFSYAIYVRSSTFGTIANSSAYSDRSTAMYIGYGTDILKSIVSNFNITNITAQTRTGGPVVYLPRTNWTSISNSNIIANNSYALSISFSYYINLTSNNLSSNISYALYDADSNWLTSSYSTYRAVGSGYGAGIYRSSNNIFLNDTFVTPANIRRPLYFYTALNNSVINSSIERAIFIFCNSFDVNIINSTLNRSNIQWTNPSSCASPGQLNNMTVRWYLNFSVQSINGSIMNTSTVIANDTYRIVRYNATTDALGNTANWSETWEFVAIGVFNYSGKSFQPNFTSYNNYTFETPYVTNFFQNRTNLTINQSATITLWVEPIHPRISNISINKGEPILVDALNTTIAYAIVDYPATTPVVNFTVWNASGDKVIDNIPYVTNSSMTNFSSRNFTLPIIGLYTVQVAASDPRWTDYLNYTFLVVNQTAITACGTQLLPYRNYIVSGLGFVCGPLDKFAISAIGAHGARLTIQAPITGAFPGNSYGLYISNVDNFTVISNGGGLLTGFVSAVYVNTSNNITLNGVIAPATRTLNPLYINGTDGVWVFNGSYTSAAPNVNAPIKVLLSKNIWIDSVTTSGTTATTIFSMANITNVTVAHFTFGAPPAGKSVFIIEDANYTTLYGLTIGNWSVTTAAPPHTLIKCERCNGSIFYNNSLSNASVGFNLTDCSHTQIYKSTVENPMSTLDSFSDTALSIYSTGALVTNNSFYDIFITNSITQVKLESKTGWNILNTTFENLTLRMYKLNLVNTYGFYSANASNTSIYNSSMPPLVGAVLGAYSSSIHEATLIAIDGNTFLWLYNTTYNPTNVSISRNPFMNFHVAWSAEVRVNSSQGNTPVIANASNVTDDFISGVTGGTLNTTYWFGMLDQGYFNLTSLPNAYLNQTPHKFLASARYSTQNSSSVTMNTSQFVELWVNYDVTKGCGRLTLDTNLTANITVEDPVCFTMQRGLTLDCKGYWIIANIQGIVGVATNDVGSIRNYTIRNCVFNSSASGSFLAAINISSPSGTESINNSFFHRGNISYIGSPSVYFINNTGIVYLGANDYSIFYSGSTISNLNIINSTFTASSTEGGTFLYEQQYMLPIAPLLNITNSTFRTLGNIERLMYLTSTSGGHYIMNSKFYLNNQNNTEGLYYDLFGGNINFTDVTLTTSTGRAIRFGSSTQGGSFNSQVQLTELVIGDSAIWDNRYKVDAHVQFENGTACFNCFVYCEDATGGIINFTTGLFGDIKTTSFPEFMAIGGDIGEAYFVLNHANQVNLTNNANLTYYSPYNCSSSSLVGGDTYYGENVTFINSSVNLTIILHAPPTYAPVVTLISPPDNTTTTVFAIYFVFNVTDDKNLTSACLYANFTTFFEEVACNASEVINNTVMFIFWDIPQGNGSYVWNVLATDMDGLDAFAPANFSLTIGPAGTTAGECGYGSGLWFALFGVGAALFFALICFMNKAHNSGIFRFMFISMGILCLIFTAGSMLYLARNTEGTTEDVSGTAETFTYALYALAIVFAIWVIYFVLGILIGGVKFATLFLEPDRLPKRKKR